MKLLLAVTFSVWLATLLAAEGQLPSRTTWDGVYSEDQSARGSALYATNCALCHGPTLTGADGPPLTGVEFASSWNGLALSELFERIRQSMPLDDPGKMTVQTKIDVLAYILSINGFPHGSAELSRDDLARIGFVATKR